MKRQRQAISLKYLLACILLVGVLQYAWVYSLLHNSISTSSQREENSDQGLILQKNSNRLGPIFYNIFIPENDTAKQENALRIVKEQMQQRMLSEPSLQSPVWYTLVGSANMTGCQPNCREISRVSQGDEVNTLQALWEYCQDHPEQLVTYLHDKGSFHFTEHNEHTRRAATKSALDCRIEMAKRSDMSTYNVCAGTMIILPQYLCKANMWSAKCSYVRNLISPKDYATSMQRMYNETLLHASLGPTRYSCLRPIHLKNNHLGLGRFAYERWVWSHPDVVPADVIPMRKINFTEFPPVWKPALSRALKGSPRRMSLHKGFGESSFARLEGRLFEWSYLYRKEPGNSSWIWDYYEGYETGTPSFKARYCPLDGAKTINGR
jgi:hypothetical protein